MGAVRAVLDRLPDKATTRFVAAKGFIGAGSSRPGARRAQASATVTRMGQDRLRAWFARRANRARADKATPNRSRLWIRAGVFVETRQPPKHTPDPNNRPAALAHLRNRSLRAACSAFAAPRRTPGEAGHPGGP